MSPESFDIALRRLALLRSRRAALATIGGIAITAVTSVSEARKRERTRKREQRQEEGKTGSCKVRHSEQEILNFIAKAGQEIRAVGECYGPCRALRIGARSLRGES